MNNVVTRDGSINFLPPELLIRIFLLSQKHTQINQILRYPHLRLSCVCRYWREIINGFPGFWTDIQFSPWRGREFIQEWVHRSGSAQLSVFSPQPTDFYSPDSSAKEILAAFTELLECTSHRIRFLFIIDPQNRCLAKILAGKMLPVLNSFIFRGYLFGTSEGELGAIIKSTPKLEYLEIYPLLSPSSLSELQPCLSRLKGLVVPVTDAPFAIYFLSCLALCVNLESLVIHTETMDPLIIKDTYSLPNLVYLCIEHYTIMDYLRVPALRCLTIMDPPDSRFPEPKYSFLDEYDLSSVTHLSILYYDTLFEEFSTIFIRGSAGLRPRKRYILSLFEEGNPEVDIGGNILPSIQCPEYTQFSLATHTRYRNAVQVDGPAVGSEPPFIPNLSSKLSPKLCNLEALLIDPFYYTSGSKPYGRHSISDVKLSLRTFFIRIFDTFISGKLRWLVIKDTQGHLELLQIMFNAINECSSLSHLETLTFRIRDDTFSVRYKIDGHAFGKELVNFLRLRQAADYPALQKFEVESSRGITIPERWITEAATLGTQIHHFPYEWKHVDFDSD